MAPRGAAGCRHGQGEGVPAIRAPSQRLVTGALAELLSAAVLWYVLAQGGGASQSKLLALAGAGCVLLAAAMVVGWPRLVALAVLLLAAPDAVVLAMRGPIPLAPVLAAGLLGASELAYWSAELRAGGRDVRFALALRLAVRLLAMAAVGAALGLLLLAVAELPASGSLDLTVLGAVAVVAVVGLAAWLVMASVGGGAGSGES